MIESGRVRKNGFAGFFDNKSILEEEIQKVKESVRSLLAKWFAIVAVNCYT